MHRGVLLTVDLMFLFLLDYLTARWLHFIRVSGAIKYGMRTVDFE